MRPTECTVVCHAMGPLTCQRTSLAAAMAARLLAGALYPPPVCLVPLESRVPCTRHPCIALCLPASAAAWLQANGFGIDSIAALLKAFGYTRRDFLAFPRKRLRAFWFSPPPFPDVSRAASAGEGERDPGTAPSLPRVFVSELAVEELSTGAQVSPRCVCSRPGCVCPSPGCVCPSPAVSACNLCNAGRHNLLAHTQSTGFV